MRVVIVNYVLTVMRGGGETRDLAWASGLRRLGVDVSFASIRPLDGRLKYPVPGHAVHLIRAPHLRPIVYSLMGMPKTSRLSSLLLDAETRIFCSRATRYLAGLPGRLDIVHASHLYPMVALREQRPDTHVIVRNMGGIPPQYVSLVPRADAIIGDGWSATNFERLYGRSIQVVPGGVDVDLFKPGPRVLRARLGLENREVILFVGRIAPVKNLILLLEALALLRQRRPLAVVIVAGEGALDGQARAAAERLGLGDSVRWAGHVDHEELPPYYSAADVFALSSSFDNSPNSVLEAMASGCPVVATNVGGVPLYVRSRETGLLVEPNDAASLAEGLYEVLADRDRAAKMAARARDFVLTNQTWERSTQTLLQVYESVLAQR